MARLVCLRSRCLISTFVPLPSSADALMLLLSTTNPSWMLLYAFMATSGSALGCWILYLISRRAGARALNRFSDAKQQRVKNWIERYDVFAVLVATLLPPPFPFKLFVVTAGVFRFSLLRFMLAIIVGRAFRFLLEGLFCGALWRTGEGDPGEVLSVHWTGAGCVDCVVCCCEALIRRDAERLSKDWSQETKAKFHAKAQS